MDVQRFPECGGRRLFGAGGAAYRRRAQPGSAERHLAGAEIRRAVRCAAGCGRGGAGVSAAGAARCGRGHPRGRDDVLLHRRCGAALQFLFGNAQLHFALRRRYAHANGFESAHQRHQYHSELPLYLSDAYRRAVWHGGHGAWRRTGCCGRRDRFGVLHADRQRAVFARAVSRPARCAAHHAARALFV